MTEQSGRSSRPRNSGLIGIGALLSVGLFTAGVFTAFGSGADAPKDFEGPQPVLEREVAEAESTAFAPLADSAEHVEPAVAVETSPLEPVVEDSALEVEAPATTPPDAFEAAAEPAEEPAPDASTLEAEPEPSPTPEPTPEPVTSPPPAVDATAYAVVERACGNLIWGLNEDEQRAPASLTKIVTAIAIVDSLSLDETAYVNVSGSQMRARGSSVMGVEPGQRYTVRDLVYGLMLRSGNDAALVLAEHAGRGDRDAFMAAMNAKAAELGMSRSNFANPHGLDANGHYSTPLDMAKAGIALLERPFLAEMSEVPTYQPERGASMQNGNRLLVSYEGAYGVKIGYTGNARQTIVAAAERDGRHIIVSLFGSTDRYGATAQLLDWAFDNTRSTC